MLESCTIFRDNVVSLTLSSGSSVWSAINMTIQRNCPGTPDVRHLPLFIDGLTMIDVLFAQCYISHETIRSWKSTTHKKRGITRGKWQQNNFSISLPDFVNIEAKISTTTLSYGLEITPGNEFVRYCILHNYSPRA